MVNDALVIISTVIRSCVKWFDQIINAIDGSNLIVACLITVFAIGIILEPLRGSMSMKMSHYTKNTTHSKESKKQSKSN